MLKGKSLLNKRVYLDYASQTPTSRGVLNEIKRLEN